MAPPILSSVAWPTAPYAPGTAFVPSVYAPGTQIVPAYAWQTRIDAAAQALEVARIQAATHPSASRTFLPSSSPSVPSSRSPVSSTRMGMRIQQGWQKFQPTAAELRQSAKTALAPVEEAAEEAVDTEAEAAAAVRKTRWKAGLLIGAAIGILLAVR